MTTDKASLVLRNGAIHTLSAGSPIVEAMAIGANGRILAVGASSDLKPLVGSSSRVVDLRGRFVMPGIVDFHLHALSSMVIRLHSVELGGALDFDAVLQRVAAAALKPGGREWVIGSAFGAPALTVIEAEGVTARKRLDAVSNGRPIILEHVSGHGGFANTLALERAGVNATTPNPADGEIVKAANGEPTGLLRETAAWLVQRAIPRLSRNDMIEVARAAIAMFNGAGITAFSDASAGLDAMEVFRALDDAGGLSCWAGFTMALSPTCAGYNADAAAAMLARRDELCGPHMNAPAAKIFLDGVPSLRTAAMLQPYALRNASDAPSDGGAMSRTLDELVDEMAGFDKLGLSVKVHAVGDRAVRTVLDAVEQVRRRNGADGPQHHIAHGQFITEQDIPRLTALNVLADLCPPLWFPSAASNAHQRVAGAERYAKTWPIKSILAAGADAAAGSDWLTVFHDIDPWQALAGMLTRKDPSGIFAGVHNADEAISLEQALPLFTRNSARAMRIGDKTGQLAPGLSADAIVLDRDLFTIKPDEIAATKVEATLFEGRVVHGAL